jgi:hypothetical protein
MTGLGALATALAAIAILTRPVCAHTYFCCQYDVPRCDGVQDPPDMARAAAACQANGGNPKPNSACAGKYCGAPPGSFHPSGTFDNPDTKAGIYTEEAKDGTLSHEYHIPIGVELVYRIGATTSECTKIATIQVEWSTDAGGRVHHPSEEPSPLANSADRDKSDADGGYCVDFDSDQTTPYYQDDGGGKLDNGTLGTSDGHGNGGTTHTSDAPTSLPNGWIKHFEVWTVCIEGHNVGEVLAGIVWHVSRGGGAEFDDKNPAEPSQHFKDALHSWEHNHPSFTEPGGGFQF